MKNTRASQPHPDEASPACAGPDGGVELVAACAENADELLQVLLLEADTLRRFDHQGLLAILPQKERLVGELAARLDALDLRRKGRESLCEGPPYDILKLRLAEVKRINDSNHLFIEGSIDCYQGLLDCVRPSAYGPRQEAQTRHEMAPCKGMTFRKEA